MSVFTYATEQVKGLWIKFTMMSTTGKIITVWTATSVALLPLSIQDAMRYTKPSDGMWKRLGIWFVMLVGAPVTVPFIRVNDAYHDRKLAKAAALALAGPGASIIREESGNVRTDLETVITAVTEKVTDNVVQFVDTRIESIRKANPIETQIGELIKTVNNVAKMGADLLQQEITKETTKEVTSTEAAPEIPIEQPLASPDQEPAPAANEGLNSELTLHSSAHVDNKFDLVEPKREDFPENKKGKEQFNLAHAAYVKANKA